MDGGLPHPNWNQNLKFAIKVQEKAEELYPGLFKPIMLTKSRYNQHTGKYANIIEVGATGNTLEQCLTSMKYLSAVMNEILKSLHDRKSVRVFTEEPISDADKTQILEAALAAPSAGCQLLYTILDITDQAKKEKLADLCDHQPFIAKAPMVLIFFRKLSAAERSLR